MLVSHVVELEKVVALCVAGVVLWRACESLVVQLVGNNTLEEVGEGVEVIEPDEVVGNGRLGDEEADKEIPNGRGSGAKLLGNHSRWRQHRKKLPEGHREELQEAQHDQEVQERIASQANEPEHETT